MPAVAIYRAEVEQKPRPWLNSNLLRPNIASFCREFCVKILKEVTYGRAL